MYSITAPKIHTTEEKRNHLSNERKSEKRLIGFVRDTFIFYQFHLTFSKLVISKYRLHSSRWIVIIFTKTVFSKHTICDNTPHNGKRILYNFLLLFKRSTSCSHLRFPNAQILQYKKWHPGSQVFVYRQIVENFISLTIYIRTSLFTISRIVFYKMVSRFLKLICQGIRNIVTFFYGSTSDLL